ncbi:MAG: hypothetical protein ACFE0J_11935 [Elainellaceae cyanobacterium]
MEPKSTESNSLESKPPTFKAVVLLFSGGAGAGLIAFALFGGIWQVNHFWGVMVATSVSCGLLAVLLRKNFQAMLNAVMDNLPWI